ncbi:hypothetical protein QBC47DRAFT_357895 [Echria macrotheca]|uniref:F-box domain-containing protein n=1 Tax=Echria macrotheca TaxID=438768 RepID=A0AAJ0FC56_9PEZI|nr:hypothetical protein QBC47DRAFT_357895 [Echria macrotheca]
MVVDYAPLTFSSDIMVLSLLDLPEEHLLMIMKLLDPGAIQCLRRTTQVFLRLFSHPTFRDSHYHYGKKLTKRLPWSRANLDIEREGYSDSVRALLRSEETRKQCFTCQKTSREKPQLVNHLANDKSFCRACGVLHPAAFFPPSQRDNGIRVKSTCIGQTGYVRLCEHEVITRAEIGRKWRTASQLSDADTGKAKCVILKQCKHPSHEPKISHDVQSPEGPVISRHTCPWAALWRCGHAVVLDLRWTGHMCHVSPDENGSFSAAAMEQRIHELRRGAAEYMVPQTGPGNTNLPEMRCFDPNACGCLDYGGRYPSFSRSAVRPDGADTCCLVHPNARLLPLRDSTSSLMNPPEVPRHFTQSMLSGALGGISGYLILPCRCAASAQCLLVFYCRRIVCGPAWQPVWRTLDYAWFEALDPDSYSLCQDQSSRGALWCLDPSCTKFYRYLERPVVRKCCKPAVVDFFPILDVCPRDRDYSQRPIESTIAGTWYEQQLPEAIRRKMLKLLWNRVVKHFMFAEDTPRFTGEAKA